MSRLTTGEIIDELYELARQLEDMEKLEKQ